MTKETLEYIISEINKLKDLLELYNKNSLDLPSNFNYRDTILSLQHLRNKQKTYKRQDKKNEKEV